MRICGNLNASTAANHVLRLSGMTAAGDGRSRPGTFFFESLDDPRIANGPKHFCWNKTNQQIRKEWVQRKDALVAVRRVLHCSHLAIVCSGADALTKLRGRGDISHIW